MVGLVADCICSAELLLESAGLGSAREVLITFSGISPPLFHDYAILVRSCESTRADYSTVELECKVVIVFSGSDQHVAITTSITTSSPRFSSWLMLSR